jgi:hypothetical protein
LVLTAILSAEPEIAKEQPKVPPWRSARQRKLAARPAPAAVFGYFAGDIFAAADSTPEKIGAALAINTHSLHRRGRVAAAWAG